MKHIAITVTGKVQGVWFRAYTREKAKELGLTGWVRNQADGSVIAEACGGEKALAAFVAALNIGPPGADVEDVQVTELQAETYRDFVIRD